MIPGQPNPYWTLENSDGFYYVGYKKNWVSQLHQAAMLSEELAERIQKRYPGSQIEKQTAYDVFPKEHLSDVGEPSATAALSSAAKLAALDGMSLETLLVTAEKSWHAAKAA